MKKLFLASSFSDVSNLFKCFVNVELEGKVVTFIPTASIPEEVNFYVGTAKKAFEKLGLIVDELDISKVSKEEIANKIESNDFIYISGGNAFYLLQELKRTGADKVIADQIAKGKIYIGESAGSVIMSPNIEYISMMDDKSEAEDLDNFQALSIVDFYPVPHCTNFPFKKTVEKIIKKYDSILDLRPINNKQVIVVNGDKIDV